MLVFAVLAAGWYGYRYYRSQHVEMVFVPHGATLPDLRLTFYPDQLAFAAPSPPPALGELQLHARDRVDLGRDLVPERAVVRYEAEGVGAGFVFVELGKPLPPIVLHAPKSLRGRIGEPIGLWSFGWRCAGFVPVAGAEVLAMGGGEHGVVLATSQSDAEGRFEIPGIDPEMTALTVRIRAPGYALAQLPLSIDGEDYPPVIPMVRTTAIRGTIHAPANVDLTSVHVIARGLPGIEARPHPDGGFVLDHVPPGSEPRLVLYGLAPGLAHAPARGVRGKNVQIDLVAGATVRGRVVEKATRVPMGGVLVFCGDDATVRADANGYFELTRLMPGEAEIVAQWQSANRRKRQLVRVGRQQLTLSPGQVVEDCIVAID